MIKIVGFIPIFQSTLPREERLFGFGIRVIISIFQSTLPREERRPCSRHSLRILLFQSTLPREERRYPHGLQSLLFHNFNPRSHERSDIPAGSFHCCLHYISIHAPTRGATSQRRKHSRRHKISIHAPTRGATHCGSMIELTFQFQSTLPREERRLAQIGSRKEVTFQSTLPREERPRLRT